MTAAFALREVPTAKIMRVDCSKNHLPDWPFNRTFTDHHNEWWYIPPSMLGHSKDITLAKNSTMKKASVTRLLQFLHKHASTKDWNLQEILDEARDAEPEFMKWATAEQSAGELIQKKKKEGIAKVMDHMKGKEGMHDMNDVMGYRKNMHLVT